MSGETVLIHLDRQRRLRYDLNAMALLEEQFAVSVGELDTVPATAASMRTLLWAGLLHDDPSLTLEDAGRLVDFANFGTVAETIGRAMARAQDTDAPVVSEGNPPTAGSIGPKPAA